jgi:hypothetical protein
MLTLFLLLLIYILGYLIAVRMTYKIAEIDEPLINKADLNFALTLCLLSWIWVVVLKLEK